jgi:FkbM family methyltransferase
MPELTLRDRGGGAHASRLAIRILAAAYLAVFGRKAFYRWNQFLLNLGARGMSVGDPMAKTIGPGEMTFLRRIARVPGLTVFDVGANVGEYSVRLAKLCPSVRIWAFEPHPGTYQTLSGVAARLGFNALNLGFSDRPGQIDLYDYAGYPNGLGSPHASVYRQVIEDIHGSEATANTVDVTTIDAFIAANNIEHINLLKLDTEGHELPILVGAQKALNAGLIDIVQFEFNEMNAISRTFLHDFYRVLPGYTLYRMVVDGLAKLGAYQPRTHELFFLQNIVAVREGLTYSELLI